MISIDTDLLIQLAQTSQNASSQLESAAGILNQITTHDNWGCWEREEINANIIAVKNSMMELMSSAESYTSKVAQAAQQFVDTENGLASMFESVEGLLGKILSIPVPVLENTPDIIGSVNSNAGSYPEIVSFADILNGMESV